MSDVKRVWTADEILGELPEPYGDDPGHDAMLEEAAAHWARCTRLMATAKKLVRDHEYCEALVCDLIDDLRAAIDEEGDK